MSRSSYFRLEHETSPTVPLKSMHVAFYLLVDLHLD